jgi:hypothetical protein
MVIALCTDSKVGETVAVSLRLGEAPDHARPFSHLSRHGAPTPTADPYVPRG